jgi:hypothetical protein
MTSARERFDGIGNSDSAVQRKETGGVGKHTLVQALDSDHGGGVGKHSLVEQVQRKLGGAVAGEGGSVADAAAHGVSGSSTALPHGEAIQRSFGHHDVSGIQAHTDGAAATGAQAMGAQAFATGNHVAFAGAPDLHTAAHEAAHVVQQRGGISLKGGVGAEGDAYEQHADAVADVVVAGGSAAGLLDRHASGGGQPAGGAVQKKIGADQASGVKIRKVSTAQTGAITGKPVWGKYPVRWDHDGTSTQVDANDDNYEVAGATLAPATPPVVSGPTVAPPATSGPEVPAPITPAVMPPRRPTVTPTPAPATAAPAKQPDRDLSHFDDADFQEQWLAKQAEVHDAVQAFVPKFQALDAAAEVRVRGSIATGVKANPDKVDPVSGKRLLFNPTDFDIDAYIASDKLYKMAVQREGTSDGAVRGKIPGSKLPAVNAIIREMRVALAKISGNRDAPAALRFRFNVILRSVRNDQQTMRQDGNGFGEPMTVEAPEHE